MDGGDDVMEFFDFSRPFERKVISGGYCNGTVATAELNTQQLPKRVHEGTEYSASYAKKEEERLIKAFSEDVYDKAETSRLDEVDDMSSVAADDAEHLRQIRGKQLMEPLFSKYNFIVDSKQLLINESKSKILEEIRTNPVVILEGRTGCGKTTQVPQYLLEDAFMRKEYCNIVVTQPRKIAAISIAKRVSEERSSELGSLVGFKVGLKEKLSPDTRLTYVTTGVLLQWLIKDQSMKRFTHVILDEVHEREVDMDFLLIIVRRLLATNSSNTKVILMSATIDGSEFSQYFKIPRPGSLLAPMLSVASSSKFDVRLHYLDQIDQLQINFKLNYDKPEICRDMYTVAGRLAICLDRVTDKYETAASTNLDYKPSIIVFLPGINEIDRMAEELQNLISMQGTMEEKTEFTILKLHSMLTSEEQARVFMRPAPGLRKVILSTNIAESSVTIPDVKYVIDFCLQRILVTDAANNFTALRLQWASKNNCIQRAGRVGRVMNGRVYRLVHQNFYEQGMSQSTLPEMIRCPLGSVVLKSKLLGFGSPKEILAMALSPPNLTDITNTVLQLKEMGALLRTVNGVYDPFDGDLTYMGKLMSHLPIDLSLAKLIVLGYVFSVLQESIIIAAGMNVKNIFYQLRTVGSYARKLRWSDGSCSDGIAILIAYTMWRTTMEQGTGGNAVAWCHRAQLDRKSLAEMAELVHELKLRLEYANVREVAGAKRVIWSEREKTVVLKVVMAGAFYPNYFTTTTMVEPDKGERRVYMEVGGRDPFRTVFLTGFDNRKYIGPLYRDQIKHYISDGDTSKHGSIKVDFEDNTNRVYIRFTDQRRANDSASRIHEGVYIAVKQHQLKRAFELRVMHQKEAIEFATRHNLGTWEDNQWNPRRIEIPNARLTVVPPIHCPRVRAIIAHVEHPGRFFVRPLDEANARIFQNIEEKLNGGVQLLPFDSTAVFQARQIVAAPLAPGSQRYGRVQLLTKQYVAGSAGWEVDFIDYGLSAVLPIRVFRQLSGPVLGTLATLPGRVFQAALAEVQSAAFNSPRGFWSVESTQKFQQLVGNRSTLLVEIYSVVNQVASVVLRRTEDPDGLSINQMLVASRDAQPSEETYLSKLNHQKRVRIQREISFNPHFRKSIENDDSELLRFIDDDEQNFELPPELLRLRLSLHGPHSPLVMGCTSALFSGYDKVVTIESESINSVLLDPSPQDTHSKMLIAACVNESGGRRLITRNTTVMPNIPGISLLMTLIFAPTCLLKKNKKDTRVTGVLAGLGLHPEQGVSIYPEHDLSLAAEVDITTEDIADINSLRYSMDSILQSGRNEDTQLLSEFSVEALMVKVKEYLIKILERERNIITGHESMAHDFHWTEPTGGGPGPSAKKVKNDIYSKAIFPLHDTLVLSGRDEYQRLHCSELHRLAASETPFPEGGIRCQLCMLTLGKNQMLRLHLLTQVHLEKEKKIMYR
ncbi:probable ATP-dependent RNA helicase spindle-E [Anopheles ziemanni]|uniref:probable ATP-dependent RNA helicase spindle-E n=1 Tax=Anopheles coustani TaxID=139045 RepID=UPI00265840B2|nr:probable ATP-dependent RNA helicase spindle-E [Anopheles coustani]XP_058173803.1 probable ATP-dependent RNA helicase spindle-E [Anopheles ziemanni]